MNEKSSRNISRFGDNSVTGKGGHSDVRVSLSLFVKARVDHFQRSPPA